MEVDLYKLLHVFESKARVEIVKLLLQFEWRSLSDIAEKLETCYGRKMTLPGVLKHMKELEAAGIVRHETGIYAKKPDARKTVYCLEGRQRVEQLLYHLENDIGNLLHAGLKFSETARLARKIQGTEYLTKEERENFESLLGQCESQNVFKFLTEDEKKKIKIWRMMAPFLE